MTTDLNISYAGRTVTIIGGGPSLKGFNFERVADPVIAVNDACYVHKSDIIVSMDAGWHMRHGNYLAAYDGFLVTDREARRKDAHIVKLMEGPREEMVIDEAIKAANLSGFLALALAIHLGAKKVVLLGYDGGYTEDSNWYDNPNAAGERGYSDKNAWFDVFKHHDIVNVGQGSKINSFRKIHIDAPLYES